METVTISRRLALSIGASFVAALLGLAFLVGRESMRSDVKEAPRVVDPVIREAPAGPAPQEVTERVVEVAKPRSSEEPARVPEAARAVEAPGQTDSHPTDERTAVVEYLQAMDRIQTAAGSDDPRQFAQQLLTEALSGDGSGFQKLARSVRDAEAKVRVLSPPPPCEAHHAAALEALRESGALIGRLEKALASKDADALAAISGSATALQQRTDELQREEKRLRDQFRVPAR